MTSGMCEEYAYPQPPVVKNTFVHIPLPHDLQGLLKHRRTRSCPSWSLEQSNEAELVGDWGSFAKGYLRNCACPSSVRCISEAPTDASSARAETSDEAETASSFREGEEDQTASSVQEGEEDQGIAPDAMPRAYDHTMLSGPCTFQMWMDPMSLYPLPDQLDAVYYGGGELMGGFPDHMQPMPDIAAYHYGCSELPAGPADCMQPAPEIAAYHYSGSELSGGPADLMQPGPDMTPYHYGAITMPGSPSDCMQPVPEIAAYDYGGSEFAGVPADRMQPVPEASTYPARSGESPAPVLCLVDALQELPSVGSVGHSQGLCTPCAFTLKGCQAGKDCRFCHACDAGEHKRRKKEKLAIRRTEDQVKRELGICAPGAV